MFLGHLPQEFLRENEAVVLFSASYLQIAVTSIVSFKGKHVPVSIGFPDPGSNRKGSGFVC